MKPLVFIVRLLALLLLLLTGPAVYAQAPAWQMAMATNQSINIFPYTITATASDASGNVYLAGAFTGTATFGTTTLFTTNSAMFVAKWSTTTNNFLWAQQASSSDPNAATAVAVNGASVYVAGNFEGPIAFGNTTFANIDGINNDIFIAKLTDAGSSASFTWAQSAGGQENDEATAITANGTSVCVAGMFSGPAARFGSTVLGNTSLIRGNDIFVTKLADAGATANFVWTQQIGSTDSDFVTAVALSGTSIYVAGYFVGPTATFGTLNLTSLFGNTGFVAKLTDAGSSASFTWVLPTGGTSNTRATAMTVNGTNVYVAGNFRSWSVAFGSTVLSNAYQIFSTATYDVFVAKLVDMGTNAAFVWAQRAGGTGDDEVKAIALNGTSIYIAGSFRGDILTPSYATIFGNTALSSVGGTDVFVAKLTESGSNASFVWAQSATGMGNDVATGVNMSGATVHVAGFSNSTTATFGSYTITGSTTDAHTFLASLTEGILATRNSPQLANLTLHPNPAYTRATVQIPAVPGAMQATLTLTDALGRVVLTHTAGLPTNGLRHELNLFGLSPGLYVLHVQTGTATATRRLVVE